LLNSPIVIGRNRENHRSPQSPKSLSKIPGRQQRILQILRIHEHNIHIAMQRPMLETIIQQMYRMALGANCRRLSQSASLKPPCTYEDRHPCLMCDQQWLIAISLR
jgi:hypothetical protein